jgi:hypothetical protein
VTPVTTAMVGGFRNGLFNVGRESIRHRGPWGDQAAKLQDEFRKNGKGKIVLELKSYQRVVPLIGRSDDFGMMQGR